jgi:hypothetical protein
MTISPEFLGGGKARITLANGDGLPHIDEVNLFRAAARKKFIADALARFPALETAWLVGEIERIAQQAAAKPEEKPTGRGDVIPPPDRRQLYEAMGADVQADAMTVLKSAELLKTILSDIELSGVTGERKLAAMLYLVGTSRLLCKPVSAIIQGPSTSGKSYILDCVSKLFPPEAVFVATSITPNALYYLPDGSLSHKWIVAGERSRVEDDERAEATRALREMLSAGEITKLLPEKNKDGVLETRTVHQTGPIAFTETTTLPKLFDEDSNRCVLLQTDEREDQTRRILTATVASRAGNVDIGPIIRRHHAIQRALEQIQIIIPFADTLAQKFPTARTEARRAFGHMLSVIESSALLHQFQRQRQDGKIVASLQDYQLARRLLADPMSRLLGRALSPAAQRFLDRLKPRVAGRDTFTTRDAGKGEPASEQAIRSWLRELSDLDLVEVVEPPHGPKAAVWRMVLEAESPDAGSVLPDLETT